MPSSSVSTETPSQTVSSFDHLVTQWMSRVISSLGKLRNSSQVHRRDLAGGCKPERDGALSDGVGELAPRVDELVEVLVERLERPSEDVPMQLLADQREVDELDERRLELPPDLLTLMLSQRRQM